MFSAWKAIDRCRDHWKVGKRSLDGSVVVLYILLSLPSVREREECEDGERESVCGDQWEIIGGGEYGAIEIIELWAIEHCEVVSVRAEKFFLSFFLSVVCW